jgi:Cd2+/Zn2+-exporting ATPase
MLDSLPEGILSVSRNNQNGALNLSFDPERLSERAAADAMARIDHDFHQRFRTCSRRLQGHLCETCAARLEKQIESLPGIRSVQASYLSGRLRVDYDPQAISEEDLTPAIGPRQQETPENGLPWETLLMTLCGFSLAGGVAASHAGGPAPVPTTLWLLAYLTGGWFGVQAGFKSLMQRAVDVDLLMVLAALGAAWIGHPFEGGMLLFLFALSNVLQSHALDRSRQAIRALMNLRPDHVSVREGSDWSSRPVEQVTTGSRVLVKPGESIALDGTVLSGESAVDESSITGESIPVPKTPGDNLFAGTLNQGGSLEMQVTRPASDSTLARVVAMVEDAQAQKARTQRFLEKAEQRYALGVILLTLALIFIPWPQPGASFSERFYRAMTVMVVASPCALVISTPAAFLSAIGGAARKGVLFKGGVHLERVADVEVVAFDKTGTLTRGKPEVTEILSLELEESDLLRRAASIESHSEHPLAGAILAACADRGLSVPEPEAFRSFAGKGASAIVEGKRLLVGSLQWMQEHALPLPSETLTVMQGLQDQGRTLILVAEGDDHDVPSKLVGVIAAADRIRQDAREMIQALKQSGIRRVAMLTGDHPRVANHIAQELDIDDVFAGLLPADKVAIVRQLEETGAVAMVGDGVNDAPALASAHVGIAMGAAGTDVAMETADVVLMSDNLHHLVNAFRLAQRARRVVIQNLSFALGVILLLVVSALTVGIPLPLGVIGHEGSTVLVCLNGLRLLKFRST